MENSNKFKSIDQLLQEAKDHIELNDYKSADSCYKEVLMADNKNLRALTGKGIIAERKKDFGSAKRYYQEAIDNNFSTSDKVSLEIAKKKLSVLETLISSLDSDYFLTTENKPKPLAQPLNDSAVLKLNNTKTTTDNRSPASVTKATATEPFKKSIDKNVNLSLFEVIKAGNLIQLQEMVNQGASLSQQKDETGKTVLIIALINNQYEVAEWLIKQTPKLIKEKTVEGQTPFTYCARMGKNESMQWLINHGISIQEKNRYGNTALMVALLNKQYISAEWLVKQQPDLLRIENNSKYTPLTYCAHMNKLKSVQ